MASSIPLPEPLRKFFALFPLHTYPAIHHQLQRKFHKPTIWILPPRDPSSSALSSDVECLKFQAYLALRGVPDLAVRWDIAQDGGIDGTLPCLHIPGPGGELLDVGRIPSWADRVLETEGVPLEGYKDEAAKDESRAWITLLEGNVHGALILSQTPRYLLYSYLFPSTSRPLESILTPPPAPLSGISSLVPPHGTHLSTSTIQLRYSEAIVALSERLGMDKWFLGSTGPTALDALLFAYLHCILHSPHTVRIEVTRRVNLVAWERRVRGIVQAAFPVVDGNP